MQLNTDKGKAIIYFDQLNYVKIAATDSRDKTVFLADGSTITLKKRYFLKS